jgi:hypothetical protein
MVELEFFYCILDDYTDDGVFNGRVPHPKLKGLTMAQID